MNRRQLHGYDRALAWGALCGLRSMSGPARASELLRRHPARTALQTQLARPRVTRALEVLALGELVADKLPFMAPRIAPVSLLGRAAAGALVGFVSARPREAAPRAWLGSGRRKSSQRHAWGCALTAALASITSAHAAYFLRRAATERLGLSPLAGALLEDAVVLLGASRLEL